MGKRGPDIGKRPDKILRETAPLPQEPVDSEDTAPGIVKWFNDGKGYGAIASEKTAPWDIWCHFSRIEGAGFKSLSPGERVEVDYVRFDQESFKYVARAVRRVERARPTAVEIMPYDSRWPADFEAEAGRLRDALGPVALRIDHHGSTSVAGLAAKPIIDIQVSVSALQPMAPYAEPLLTLGYVHVPHADDAFAPFFHRPHRWPHTHHVHVVVRGGEEERRTLAFRDYLRDHEAVARDYAQLKRRLAEQVEVADSASLEVYTRAKAGFIDNVVEEALSDGYPRGL